MRPESEEVLAACGSARERVECLYRMLAGHVNLTHMGKIEDADVDELLRWATDKRDKMTELCERLQAEMRARPDV